MSLRDRFQAAGEALDAAADEQGTVQERYLRFRRRQATRHDLRPGEEDGRNQPCAPPHGASQRPLDDVVFLTVAGVATVMRVSKMTVYRLVRSGDLPAIRVGRSFRIPEQAVHEYLRETYCHVEQLGTTRPR